MEKTIMVALSINKKIQQKKGKRYLNRLGRKLVRYILCLVL